MSNQLKYVLMGAGGWGQHWCKEVLPRLSALELAKPSAVVDIDAVARDKAAAQLGLLPSQLFSDASTAVKETRPDFAVIVVPPALHESNAATVYARTWNPPWGEYAGDSI